VRHRPQLLESFAKSHSSRSPAGKSEPTGGPEHTNLPVGRIGPSNAETAGIATRCRRVVVICSRRHSANRRRVYEDTHIDLGWRGARAGRDGVVGERPAVRRWPRAAPKRHADREAGGVSRLWRALRPGFRVDVRPLRPLLVSALLRAFNNNTLRMRGRPWGGLVVYGQPAQFSGRAVNNGGLAALVA
jgi:hypothetical protein